MYAACRSSSSGKVSGSTNGAYSWNVGTQLNIGPRYVYMAWLLNFAASSSSGVPPETGAWAFYSFWVNTGDRAV